MKNVFIAVALLAAGSLSSCNQGGKNANKLDFDPENYVMQTLKYRGGELEVRAYEGIIYVANPVDSTHHSMNIYIPEAYFKGESINGFTAETAPIFYPNQVGGYMPAAPATAANRNFGGGAPRGGQGNRPQGDRPAGDHRPEMRAPEGGRPPMAAAERENAIVAALARGYVVASAGARGRTNVDANGVYYGKAPAGLVDLKAGIRYLKYNDNAMPGDANKIISNGTSAGGAMSSLLGATGDSPDYEPYLADLGAAAGSDAIFAVSAYCPITNLDHADMAYEWQFNGVNAYRGRGGFGGEATETKLTAEQIKISNDLCAQFPAYLNSLNLKDANGEVLTLDDKGNGNFKDYISAVVIAAANIALAEGEDLSTHKWLTIRSGVVTALDWDAYINYMERQKTPPAFDALNLSTAENQLFGTSAVDAQHFTEYGMAQSTADGGTADEAIVKMMNPMYYIDAPSAHTAQHWRIRHGSKDKDTGLAISAILALALQNAGIDVDYALPWDKPHSGDYDLDELFEWIDALVR